MRPEGFYETISKSPFAQEARDSVAFVEFIADAMLEGLIKHHGRTVTQGYDNDSPPLGFVADGLYIELFIPEEKE